MNESKVYMKPNHPYAYRRGNRELPLVIGVVGIAPKGLAERLCYKVMYESDGKIDYIPLMSVDNGEYSLVRY